MSISTHIDKNNFATPLSARQLALAAELPSEESCICITHKAEFEIPPNAHGQRVSLKTTIARCEIERIHSSDLLRRPLPEEIIVSLAPAMTGSASPEELAFIAQQRTALKNRRRPSRPYEGDAGLSLAARAVHSIYSLSTPRPVLSTRAYA